MTDSTTIGRPSPAFRARGNPICVPDRTGTRTLLDHLFTFVVFSVPCFLAPRHGGGPRSAPSAAQPPVGVRQTVERRRAAVPLHAVGGCAARIAQADTRFENSCERT